MIGLGWAAFLALLAGIVGFAVGRCWEGEAGTSAPSIPPRFRRCPPPPPDHDDLRGSGGRDPRRPPADPENARG